MPSKKNNGKSRQVTKAPEEEEELEEELPLRFRWKDVEHADDDIIPCAQDLYEEIVPTWKGDKFNPNVMNAGTGRPFKYSHHAKGAGVKTKSDFKNLVFAFCLEWIDLWYKGKAYRVRCLNQFCVQSNGCTDHGRTIHKDGPNWIWPALKAGKEVPYSAIKDTQAPRVEVVLTAEQIKQAAKDEYAEVTEQLVNGLDEQIDVDHLYARQAELQAIMSGKTRKLKGAPAPAPLQLQQGGVQNAAPLAPAAQGYGSRPAAGVTSAPIYGARSAASDSTPGIPKLDKKKLLMQSANNSKSRAAASRAIRMQAIAEESPPPVPALPQQRKKPKKNKLAGPGTI